jgi:hypothetical protein
MMFSRIFHFLVSLSTADTCNGVHGPAGPPSCNNHKIRDLKLIDPETNLVVRSLTTVSLEEVSIRNFKSSLVYIVAEIETCDRSNVGPIKCVHFFWNRSSLGSEEHEEH